MTSFSRLLPYFDSLVFMQGRFDDDGDYVLFGGQWTMMTMTVWLGYKIVLTMRTVTTGLYGPLDDVDDDGRLTWEFSGP